MAEVKDGIKAALVATDAGGKAREAAELRASSATQAELFGGDDAELDARMPIAPPPAPRGVGRPPGSRNRRTEQVAAYLVSRYGDPLEGLLSIAMRPTGELIREMARIATETGVKIDSAVGPGTTVMAALQMQRAAMEAALPYIHAKRAPEDDKGNVVTPVLNIGRFDATPGVSKGLSAEDFIDVTPSQQNQGVSEAEPAASDDPSSDDEG
jgi:hypothetical protein